jgi:DNA-binding transcriptional LysR family regulator
MAWDDLRFVLNVAEEGTLSAAARSLGVNHSTVLRRISAFEEKRGVRLFERTGSGYAMTAESRHLLSRLREIEERIGALDRAFARLGLELDGPVRITTSDSIAAANIARHVASFQAENPRVVVDFNVSNDYADFSRLDADIAIRPGGAPTGELGGQRVCGATGVRADVACLCRTPLPRTEPCGILWCP